MADHTAPAPDIDITPERMALVTPGASGLSLPTPQMAVAELAERNKLVLELMNSVLVKDVHYGLIKGCGNKPSLFLPGAEKLASVFRFAPKYSIVRHDLGNGHREFEVKCSLCSYNGLFIADGEGTCSTMETKYRYRQGAGEGTGTIAPKAYWDLKKGGDFKAAQAAIGGPGFTVKKNDNGGWEIFTVVEKAENPDIADQWNTVKKMACKRAFVHAVRTATSTADVFTQDIEDFRDNYGAIIDITPEPERREVDASTSRPTSAGSATSAAGAPASAQTRTTDPVQAGPVTMDDGPELPPFPEDEHGLGPSPTGQPAGATPAGNGSTNVDPEAAKKARTEAIIKRMIAAFRAGGVPEDGIDQWLDTWADRLREDYTTHIERFEQFVVRAEASAAKTSSAKPAPAAAPAPSADPDPVDMAPSAINAEMVANWNAIKKAMRDAKTAERAITSQTKALSEGWLNGVDPALADIAIVRSQRAFMRANGIPKKEVK